MATTPTEPLADLIIDLTDSPPPPTAHRLAELVQAISGCSAERAELALRDPTPMGPARQDDALNSMATALVRLRAKQPVRH